MELSERYIQTLEHMGCSDITEEQYGASEQWSGQTQNASKIIMVTDGSLSVTIFGSVHHVAHGESYTIPPHTLYEGTVGPEGVIFITGEQPR